MSLDIKAVIFDLDGTLVDSAPSILGSFAAALGEAGISPVVPLEHSLIGPPLAKTLAHLAGNDDPYLLQRLTAGFKAHYDAQGVLSTCAYPGVLSLLDSLQLQVTALHICTNKRLGPTRTIMRHLAWSSVFRSIYTLDMKNPPLADKPAALALQLAEQGLSPATTAYIGDRRDDAHAAEANGLPFFYASWGYGTEDRSGVPDSWYWLDVPSDLLNYL